jgi:hypothetical protein
MQGFVTLCFSLRYALTLQITLQLFFVTLFGHSSVTMINKIQGKIKPCHNYHKNIRENNHCHSRVTLHNFFVTLFPLRYVSFTNLCFYVISVTLTK